MNSNSRSTSATELWQNVEAGRDYLKSLFVNLGGNWFDCYDQFTAGNLMLPEQAVLIHPDWIPGLKTRARLKRSFSLKVPRGQECESRRIWGYKCSLSSPIQVDHAFPYAYGGPTTPSNALFLCEEHNRLKGADVHMVQWQPANFSWLASQIAEVKHLLDRSGQSA